MALVNTVAISAEVLANSLGATGNLLSIVSNTAFINVASATAGNTINGSSYRITVAGTTPPISFGSESVIPPVVLAVYIGANGNATDQLVVQGNIPAGPVGAWAADVLLTCRKNALLDGGVNANTQWVATMYNVSNPAPYFGPAEVVCSAPTGNGKINVAVNNGGAYTSNLMNISILAGLSTGQNANTLVETLVIQQVAGT